MLFTNSGTSDKLAVVSANQRLTPDAATTSGAQSAELARQDIAGLDALELAGPPSSVIGRRAWNALWPKVLALVIAIGLWEVVVLTGWKPTYVLPGPAAVFRQLGNDLADGRLLRGLSVTMGRAVLGFGVALAIGSVIGLAVAQVKVLRSAVGLLITGLQTMPSIAWFPLAVLLFKISETAILFVVVLGAAPAIANGIIAGVDTVPPLLDRAGFVLGAHGFRRLRHVVIPAALPQIVAGMKQGWAFAWRSLMAGELIVIIANRPSIGAQLQNARDLADSEWLLATMVTILVVGIAVDAIVFGTLERSILRRRGLGA